MILDLYQNSGLSQWGKWASSKSMLQYIRDINNTYDSYLKEIIDEKKNPKRRTTIDSWLDF